MLLAVNLFVWDFISLSKGLSFFPRHTLINTTWEVVGYKPVTNYLVLDLFGLVLGRYQLKLHLTAKLTNLSDTLQDLQLQPAGVLLLGVIFLDSRKVNPVLIAVELCIVLGAEAVLGAGNDIQLLIAELKSLPTHFVIIMFVNCFPLLVIIQPPRSSWSSHKSSTFPNLVTDPQRSITQPSLPG